MRYVGNHRKNPNRILGKENTVNHNEFVRELLESGIMDFQGHVITVREASWIVGWIAARDPELLQEILAERAGR